jgi:tRNA-specific 2-thiouridylase
MEIETGKKIGEHEGLYFYTIGQRHGLKLNGENPYFVVKKDKKENRLYVSQKLERAQFHKGC